MIITAIAARHAGSTASFPTPPATGPAPTSKPPGKPAPTSSISPSCFRADRFSIEPVSRCNSTTASHAAVGRPFQCEHGRRDARGPGEYGLFSVGGFTAPFPG